MSIAQKIAEKNGIELWAQFIRERDPFLQTLDRLETLTANVETSGILAEASEFEKHLFDDFKIKIEAALK